MYSQGKENFMLVFQDNEENALVYLTIKQGDDGYTVGLDISPSLMEMSPDKAAIVIHSWVELLHNLMGDMLDHADNDPINMYIH